MSIAETASHYIHIPTNKALSLLAHFRAAIGTAYSGGLDKVRDFQHKIPSLIAQFRSATGQKYTEMVKRYRQHVLNPPERRSNASIPEHIPRHHMKFGRHVFEGMEFEAKEPTEVVINITGCKSRTVHWEDQIQHWRDENRSQFVANTRIPRRDRAFMADNYYMAQWLLRDEKSPAFRMAEERGLPVKLMCHSFGGHLVIKSLAEQASASEITERIDRFVFINPFTTAQSLNRDRWGSSVKRKLYLEGHAIRNGDMRNSDHLFDVFYAHVNKLRGEPYVWASNGPPTHTHVSTMQNGADALWDFVREFGFPQATKDAETYFYIGDRDYMADWLGSETMADEMNAVPKKVHGWHVPTHEEAHHLQNISALLDGRPDDVVDPHAAASWALPFSSRHAA